MDTHTHTHTIVRPGKQTLPLLQDSGGEMQGRGRTLKPWPLRRARGAKSIQCREKVLVPPGEIGVQLHVVLVVADVNEEGKQVRREDSLENLRRGTPPMSVPTRQVPRGSVQTKGAQNRAKIRRQPFTWASADNQKCEIRQMT